MAFKVPNLAWGNLEPQWKEIGRGRKGDREGVVSLNLRGKNVMKLNDREDSSAEKLKSSRGGSSSCFTELSKTREFLGLPQRQNDAMIKEKKKTL